MAEIYNPSPYVLRTDASEFERRPLMNREHPTTDESLKKSKKAMLTKKALFDSFSKELEKLAGSLEPWEQKYIHSKQKETGGRATAYALAGGLLAGRKGKQRFRRKAKGAIAGAIAGKAHSAARNRAAKRELATVQSREKAQLLRGRAKGHPIDPLDRADANVSEALARRQRRRQIGQKRLDYYSGK